MSKEVKINARLKLNATGTWEILLSDRLKVIADCMKLTKLDNITEVDLSGMLKLKPKRKSQKKMGYFYAEILPTIAQGFVDSGEREVDEDAAYLFLCKRFLGVKTVTVHGEDIPEIKTLSDIDDDQAKLFLDSCVMFGNQFLNLVFKSPEEYKSEIERFNASV